MGSKLSVLAMDDILHSLKKSIDHLTALLIDTSPCNFVLKSQKTHPSSNLGRIGVAVASIRGGELSIHLNNPQMWI